jgi:hypothetical protein
MTAEIVESPVPDFAALNPGYVRRPAMLSSAFFHW